MARKKHLKIKEAYKLENVFSFEKEPLDKQIFEYFNNRNKFSIEIGCGHGAYTLSMAKLFPEENFIGLDVKPARIWKGATEALNTKIKNAAFIVGGAENIEQMFSEIKFENIWITFPDPQPKRRTENRRLTSPPFLERYKKIATQNSIVNLKTDNGELYKYTIKIISMLNYLILKQTTDLYSEEHVTDIENIKTTYEKHYLEDGRTIKFVSFKLT